MSKGWNDVSLGDLIEIKHGFAFKGSFFRNEPHGDVLLTPGNFAVGGGFKADKIKYYDGPVPEDFVLHKGDLLVTMTDLSKQSDTLGYPAFIPTNSDGRRYLHNQRLGRIVIKNNKETDLGYIYYLMCSREYRNEVLSSATGTTVKHTSPDRIKQFQVTLPPISEQRAIAHILGTLDDKIELNRRMNKTLEEMAQALFKSWFVDFDPVSAKAALKQHASRHQPAPGTESGGNRSAPVIWTLDRSHAYLDAMDSCIVDLLPDRLTPSELGEIPKGWEVKPLGMAAFQRRCRIKPSEVDPATPYIGLEHMPKRCISLSDWGNADGLASSKLRFNRGDILFGKLRPYFHKVGIAALDGICSTDIVVVAPVSSDWLSFVLGHLSSSDFVHYTDAASTGTRMPRTAWKDMAKYNIVIPSDDVAKGFNAASKPWIQRMLSTIHDLRSLSAVRDALLPRLMSGEVGLAKATEPLMPEQRL